MDYELPYKSAVEDKIASVAYESRDILSHTEKYNEDEQWLEITLTYQGFSVLMYYSEFDLYGYSFLENNNTGKQLVTKFLFPFSDMPYSVYDVHNAVDDRIFDTYNFHCLYNEQQVIDAIDTVISFIGRNKNILNAVNDNEKLKSKLEESFNRGLQIVSKKITCEKINENPEKYLSKHDFDLYFYRSAETAFTDHIKSGKTGELQRFFAKESKKNKLLTYEERYLEHLFVNDFNVTDEHISSRVSAQEKVSTGIERADRISLLISLILGGAIDIFMAIFSQKQIEKEYYMLTETELVHIIPLALMIIGVYCIISPTIKRVLMHKNKGFDSEYTKGDKKANAIIALIGAVIVMLTGVYSYFDYQKAVAINENGIYYCQHIGKTEMLSYDDLQFYMIEGDYIGEGIYSDSYGDKRLVIIKDGDTDDYCITGYFEDIDVPRSIVDNLKIERSFKDIDEFYTAFDL